MNLSKSTKIIIVLILLLLAGAIYISKLLTEARIDRINLKASRDSTKTYKNKYGEVVSQNLAFVGTKKDMKAYATYLEKQGDTLRTKITDNTRQITLLTQSLKASGKGKIQPILKDTTIYVSDTKIDSAKINIVEKGDDYDFQLAGNQQDYAWNFKTKLKTELDTEDLGKDGIRVTAINRSRFIDSSETKSIVIPIKPVSFWKKVKWIGIGAAGAALYFGVK